METCNSVGTWPRVRTRACWRSDLWHRVRETFPNVRGVLQLGKRVEPLAQLVKVVTQRSFNAADGVDAVHENVLYDGSSHSSNSCPATTRTRTHEPRRLHRWCNWQRNNMR